jgi:hypothetical protein
MGASLEWCLFLRKAIAMILPYLLLRRKILDYEEPGFRATWSVADA